MGNPITEKKNNIPDVPSGWLAKWDDRYNEWYYVDLKTKKSQWEPPMTETGPPPGPPPSSNRSSQQTNYQPQPQVQPQRQMPMQQPQYYPQPQPQYYQQPQPVYVQQQVPRRNGYGAGSLALGAGGGFLGGMLLGEMLDHNDGPDVVNNYYGDDGGGGDFGGGDFGGGDF